MNKKIACIVSLGVALTGCSSIGPKQIHLDRGAYNEIIRQTDYQQLLNAIVSLSYLETASSSLSVAGITSSYSLSSQIGILPSWSRQLGQQGSPPSITQSLTAGQEGIGTTYTDSPTISYSPVSPQEFVMVMETPLSFTDINLLFNGGIDNFSIISRLLLSYAGQLDNASAASDPLLTKSVGYKNYYHFVDLVSNMLNSNQADISPVLINQAPGVMITFANAFINSTAALEIKNMLQVPSDSQKIIFATKGTTTFTTNQNGNLVQTTNANSANDVVFVKTRSLYGILAFLSHAVAIPKADLQAHVTNQLKDDHGNPFDWTPLLKGIMNIQSSDNEPTRNVFVKTYAHGHWFYIQDSDLRSKATFMLLIRLMTIKGAESAANISGPVLSIPV